MHGRAGGTISLITSEHNVVSCYYTYAPPLLARPTEKAIVSSAVSLSMNLIVRQAVQLGYACRLALPKATLHFLKLTMIVMIEISVVAVARYLIIFQCLQFFAAIHLRYSVVLPNFPTESIKQSKAQIERPQSARNAPCHIPMATQTGSALWLALAGDHHRVTAVISKA